MTRAPEDETPPLAPRWWLPASGAALGLVGVVAHALYFASPALPIDDAYITLHNAATLGRADPRFPGAAALEGATSPAHLLLVWAAQRVWSPEWASHAVGAVAAILLGAGLGRLADRIGLPPAHSLGGVALGLLAAGAPHQLFNGLETGLGAATFAWLLAEMAADTEAERDVVPILCGLAPFVRPELAILSLLLLAERARHRASRADARARLRRDLVAAIFAGAPLAIAMAWATGSPVPGTATAKRLFFAEGCWPLARRGSEAGSQLMRFGFGLGLAALLFPFSASHRVGRIGLTFLAVVLVAFTLRFPGALGHNQHRYLFPFVPLLLCGLAPAAGTPVGSTRSRPARLAWWAVTALLAVALADTLALRVPTALDQHRSNLRFSQETLVRVSQWADRELPPDAIVLIHDAGHAGHRIDRELVDMVGLKTPGARALHRAHTWPSCGEPGRGEAIHELALEREVTHLIVFARWDQAFQITAGLAYRGWGLRPVGPVFEMRDAPAPGLAYRVVELTPPPSQGPRPHAR